VDGRCEKGCRDSRVGTNRKKQSRGILGAAYFCEPQKKWRGSGSEEEELVQWYGAPGKSTQQEREKNLTLSAGRSMGDETDDLSLAEKGCCHRGDGEYYVSLDLGAAMGGGGGGWGG